MTVVVDTSVLIDHLRGRTEARDLLVDHVARGESLIGSVLTRTEVLAGMRRGEETRTDGLLEVLEWIPVTQDIADQAGHMARKFLRTHPGIDITDFVIAATAQAADAGLWTRNVKHFPMFPGLVAPY